MSWARLVGAVLLTATGCGTASQVSPWVDPAQLPRPPQAAYPDADAVYLRHEVVLRQDFVGTSPSWSEAHHDVILILNEAGRRNSNVGVPYREGYDIDIAARSIAPDGTITLLQPDRIYESTLPKRGDVKVRVFALPQIAVGTIIELRYVIRRDAWLFTTWSEDLWARLPSLFTRVTYTVHGRVSAAAKAYGTDIPFRESGDHTYKTVVWEGRDLPARIDEPNDPPDWERTPHAVFVLRQLRYASVVDYNGDWAHAIADDFYAPLVTKRAFAEDFELPSAYAALRSEPVPDRIARVYDDVRALPYRVRDPGEERLHVRPIRQILAQRTATPWEQTVLLAELLRALHVEATYALTRPSSVIDPTLPRRSVFDTGLLYVPVQPGVEREMWLQPSCAHCAPGQLRRTCDGINALLVESKDGASAPRWVVTDAPPEPPATRLVERAITLDAGGHARVSEKHVLGGSLASAERRTHATLSKPEYDERVKGWITDDLAAAEVSDVVYDASPVAGTPVAVTLSWESDALVTRAGDALLVDLTAPPFRADYMEEKPRRSDLVFYDVEQASYLYRLTPPPGYQALELPASRSLACPAGRADAAAAHEGDTLVYRVRVTTVPGRWSKDELDPQRAFFRGLDPMREVKLTLVPAPANGAGAAPPAH